MAKKTKVQKKEETLSQEETVEVAVPIKWHIPDNIITRFATNITIQSLGNDFKVSFFEAKPEIYFQGNTPPEEIRADCVASIIITADRLSDMIDALKTHLNKHQPELDLFRPSLTT